MNDRIATSGPRHLWVIVLAAGDGLRVQALTKDDKGLPVPKQYCSFGRATPMLRWAIDRATALVPAARVITVVAEQHRRLWESELSDLPTENVIVQPANRGTAPGLLLPLLHVLVHRDPLAHFLVLPSDHHVAEEGTLRAALARATVVARADKDRVVLLGMAPERPDPEYGWIMSTPQAAGKARDVTGFVEKPDRGTARRLMKAQALVNSFILAAEGSALRSLYGRALPQLLEAFLGRLRGFDSGGLGGLYRDIPVADFSKHILECSVDRLSVVPVPRCGWSDLGTAARVRTFEERQGRALRVARGHLRPLYAGRREVRGQELRPEEA